MLIAAAGNAGPKSPPLYPAADPNVIAVTATDVDDKLFPAPIAANTSRCPRPASISWCRAEGNYQFTTGTSVAAAEVSGIVALLLDAIRN